MVPRTFYTQASRHRLCFTVCTSAYLFHHPFPCRIDLSVDPEAARCHQTLEAIAYFIYLDPGLQHFIWVKPSTQALEGCQEILSPIKIGTSILNSWNRPFEVSLPQERLPTSIRAAQSQIWVSKVSNCVSMTYPIAKDGVLCTSKGQAARARKNPTHKFQEWAPHFRLWIFMEVRKKHVNIRTYILFI